MSEIQVMTVTAQTPIEVLLQVGEDGRVSARDTYSFLSPGQGDFARWARSNITENDFAESDADFTVTRISAEYGNPLTGGVSKRELEDYRLSVPFAKKLCMLSKTERGEQARDYFIAVEDKLKQVAQGLPQLTTNELVLKIAQANVEFEKKLEAHDQRLETIEQTVLESVVQVETALRAFAAPSIDHWRADMDAKINNLVERQHLSNGPFRGKLYAELEQIANVKLHSRLLRMRSRLRGKGYTYKECKALTKLDVISKDKQLRAIFEGILKKYQAIYGVGDIL